MNSSKKLTAIERQQLLEGLKKRFEKNKNRHASLEWESILPKLQASDKIMWSLLQMENTGGEPDVIGYDTSSDQYIFCDCAEETPKGRRSVCYDKEGLDSRKEHKPAQNAIDMAAEMGIEILDESMYRLLQSVGNFDLKTSSWLLTPPEIRKLGGAIFGDYRYGHVFIYHNGAGSYYAVRGFRGFLKV